MAVAVNGDATRLPFPDGTFDRIIASEVMEHIPDDLAALDELARVLQARAARMAVTIPAWLPEKVCWALSRRVPRPVRRRRPRAHLHRGRAAREDARRRARAAAPPTTPTPCTPRTGG